MKKNHQDNTQSDTMRIFLALCSECDKFNMEDVVKVIDGTEKVSTVNCNSCGNQNSVLMFTLTVPENYKREEPDKPTDGKVDSEG
jgi:transcription elongation factor Elf1